MKKVMLLLLIPSFCFAKNGFEIAKEYERVIELAHVQGSYKKARQKIEGLIAQVDTSHPLFNDIYKLYKKINKKDPNSDTQKAIKFATGRKTEFYCKDKGLVLARIKHNDGTKSKLVLLSSNREMKPGSYSIMTGGSWAYELDTEYRQPIKSEVWINHSSDKSYSLEELRRFPDSKPDKGFWRANWTSLNDFYRNSRTNGNSKEPIPMYMGVDYHLFGNKDLGYEINFKVGEIDQFKTDEMMYDNKTLIKLNSRRRVAKHLDTFTVIDSKGVKRVYNDCFQVVSRIRFKGIDI